MVANRNTKQDYTRPVSGLQAQPEPAAGLQHRFSPTQQQRVPTFEDIPTGPQGDLYCRVPQDFAFNVRGARNYPCLTAPGKRAPTVKMCDSNEQYVPLNDGFNWKGDPNATLSGQAVPQLPPGSAPGAAAHPPLRRRSPRHRTTRPPAVTSAPTVGNTPSRTWRNLCRKTRHGKR